MDNFFKEILKKIPKKIRNYNRLSMGIAGRIDEILEERNISQREFAKKMKKSESEISKWMSGKHNFTIKSIANIEAKLDTKLIYTEYDLEDIRAKRENGKKYFDMVSDSD
ncbi:MAG: helix-turn-helix transcriptional regulator [Bacteroidetes bacterium]|nr:helix-turn-helix transcriptional regulator [Bacteroidota bacterium]